MKKLLCCLLFIVMPCFIYTANELKIGIFKGRFSLLYSICEDLDPVTITVTSSMTLQELASKIEKKCGHHVGSLFFNKSHLSYHSSANRKPFPDGSFNFDSWETGSIDEKVRINGCEAEGIEVFEIIEGVKVCGVAKGIKASVSKKPK